MKTNEKKIYDAIVKYCVTLENGGINILNDDLIARDITFLVSEGLLSDQQKSVYNTLKSTPQTVKEISQQCNLPSRDVSAILLYLNKTTSLIKIGYWTSSKSNKITKRKIYSKQDNNL